MNAPRVPKVFVPQEPHRFNPTIGTPVPMHDLTPASVYGEMVVCLPPNVSFHFISPVVDALRKRMSDMQPGDYLVAIGSPRIIAVSAIIAARITNGNFKLLEWDKRANSYIATTIEGLA